ncbi:integrase [Clostridia bacterium]|nr:integrase [Clostridia bacterium]
MNDFFTTVNNFLFDYLPNQRNYSSHTIKSYRDTLRLLIKYLREELHLTVTQIDFPIFNAKVISDFADWLQNTRGVSATSRNQRISAIHSFFTYAGERDGTLTAISREIKDGVKSKKSGGKLVDYLSEKALQVLLAQPDATSHIGLRNLVFMVLMYDTGARCSEMLALKLWDLRFTDETKEIYLMGKGRKPRLVSLLPKTVAHIERYLREFHPNKNMGDVLFYTVSHGKRNPMSADTVAAFMKKYGENARTICSEMPERVHPHMMRHTRAIHYYRKGMPMVLLAEFLGHADVQSTQIYAYADTTMKRDAMIKADPTQQNTPEAVGFWENDEDMILRLSGLA